MKEINQEEYEVLKNLYDEWEWVARDNDNTLYTYDVKPERLRYMWLYEYGDAIRLTKHEHLFQFIQWEDSEPYNIAELIEEYESSQMTYFDRKLISEYERLTKESEETEVNKNIEWLKEEVKIDIDNLWVKSKLDTDSAESLISRVNHLIDQLDEPEVLSEEWIDGNKEPFHHFETKKVDYYVSTDFLKNLLVPKQELPVIPQFVADYLKTLKDNNCDLMFCIYDGTYNYKIGDWLFGAGDEQSVKNRNLIMRAWMDGYTVKEEPKYIIKLDDESYLQRYEIDNKNIVTPFRIVGHLKEVAVKFDNKERAGKVAELVGGKVEELEE